MELELTQSTIFQHIKPICLWWHFFHKTVKLLLGKIFHLRGKSVWICAWHACLCYMHDVCWSEMFMDSDHI